MLKKLLVGGSIAGVLTVGVIIGSLTVGPVFAQTQHTSPPAQAQAVFQSPDDDAAEAAVKGPDTDAVEEQVGEQNELDEQQPQYDGSIHIDDSQYNGLSEAEEAAALQTKATISAADAEAAAIVANPGATVVKTELENENGVLVYSVELSNGNDVKVDAGNGQILYTDQAGDNASEVTGAENAPEQGTTED